MPHADIPDVTLDTRLVDLTPPWRPEPETIVFIHGLGACSDCWNGWLPALVHRYRLIFFDLPGHGASPAPPTDFIWSIERLAALTLSIADTERFHLVGESIGATVALYAAIHHGHRLRSLMVSNGAHVGASIQNVESWERTIDAAGMAGWSRELMEHRFNPGAIPDADARWYEAAQARCDPACILGGLRALTGTDLAADLPGITVPTLILHPDSSPFIPVSVMAEMHAAIPQSQLQIFPHARHGLPFSHATDCAVALRRFLDEAPRQTTAP